MKNKESKFKEAQNQRDYLKLLSKGDWIDGDAKKNEILITKIKEACETEVNNTNNLRCEYRVEAFQEILDIINK